MNGPKTEKSDGKDAQLRGHEAPAIMNKGPHEKNPNYKAPADPKKGKKPPPKPQDKPVSGPSNPAPAAPPARPGLRTRPNDGKSKPPPPPTGPKPDKKAKEGETAEDHKNFLPTLKVPNQYKPGTEKNGFKSPNVGIGPPKEDRNRLPPRPQNKNSGLPKPNPPKPKPDQLKPNKKPYSQDDMNHGPNKHEPITKPRPKVPGDDQKHPGGGDKKPPRKGGPSGRPKSDSKTLPTRPKNDKDRPKKGTPPAVPPKKAGLNNNLALHPPKESKPQTSPKKKDPVAHPQQPPPVPAKKPNIQPPKEKTPEKSPKKKIRRLFRPRSKIYHRQRRKSLPHLDHPYPRPVLRNPLHPHQLQRKLLQKRKAVSRDLKKYSDFGLLPSIRK